MKAIKNGSSSKKVIGDNSQGRYGLRNGIQIRDFFIRWQMPIVTITSWTELKLMGFGS